MKRALFVILVSLLAACAPPSVVTVHSDEFSNAIELDGIVQKENSLLRYDPHFWRLRTFIDKQTGEVTYQAYLFTLYEGSRKNLKFASDDTATKLKVMPIENAGCAGSGSQKCEVIGMEVSEQALRAHISGGYRIRVLAKSGDVYMLTFTPEMIRAQLEAVAKVQAGRGL